MKNLSFLIVVITAGCFCACKKPSLDKDAQKAVPKTVQTNPLLDRFDTPFNTPPFEKIKTQHILPALLEGMRQHKIEIEAILNDSAPAKFENTIEAMEKSGELLHRVEAIYINLLAAYTSDELQEVAKKVAPLLSRHKDDILMNQKLYKRICLVVEQKEKLELNSEQVVLLEKYHKDFIRGGAGLNPIKQERLRTVNQELAMLSLKFDDNILKENNEFKLFVDNQADLKGLPEPVIQAAREKAKKAGQAGKWLFTLSKTSLIPFLKYANNRDLRKKMYLAYTLRGNHNNQLDNKATLKAIVMLRLERAKLLGYKSHADYVLEENMAKSPEDVYRLLNRLWKPALAKAKQEAEDLQAFIYKEGHDFKLKPWDWGYYQEKIQKKRLNLDQEALREYFQIDRVRLGAFAVANKLYGLRFVERTDIQKYHEDVRVFEVKEANGSHIGILYTDYFPRENKQGGAWMDEYRRQEKLARRISPIVCNVLNVTGPTSKQPALLTINEVTTLFHELGHALHGLLSDVTYRKLAGTNVPNDFVELPSQIMENWATEPQVLKMYAKHYKTGQIIPDQLVKKIQALLKFNQGSQFVRALAASFLDMYWHTLTESTDKSVEEIENICFKNLNLIDEIESRYKSTYFKHIFGGEYSAGYYSYTWSSVLDADAFEAFLKNGLFNQETSEAFRKYILSTGGTQDPDNLYRQFRGRAPRIEPLLKIKGLLE